MIYQHPYLILAALIGLSSWVLWCRYREGRLLSSASGLHIQILVLFGFGGLAFVGFPDSEPYLEKDAILHSCAQYGWPLLLGYAIAVALERRLFRQRPQQELLLTQAPAFTPGIVFAIAALGFAGCLLEGGLEVSGLKSLPTYVKSFFFPGFLIAIINIRSHGVVGFITTSVIVVMAMVIAIWSPWRSVLIILSLTILLAVLLKKPRWSPLIAVFGAIILSLLIPFQNFKKANYDAFQEDPMAALNVTLSMSFEERWQNMGEFMTRRINYMRELTYVCLALESGKLELQEGRTYSGILYQLVPRVLWPGKPEMGSWAGYNLPREVGLLQEVDTETSWAVNMFAEATYNYGLWCLLWFVPAVFLLAQGMELLLKFIAKTRHAFVLGNVVFFYFFFSQPSLIFGASMTIALLLVVKSFDLGLIAFGLARPGEQAELSNPIRTATTGKPAGRRRVGRRIRA